MPGPVDINHATINRRSADSDPCGIRSEAATPTPSLHTANVSVRSFHSQQWSEKYFHFKYADQLPECSQPDVIETTGRCRDASSCP